MISLGDGWCSVGGIGLSTLVTDTGGMSPMGGGPEYSCNDFSQCWHRRVECQPVKCLDGQMRRISQQVMGSMYQACRCM